MWPTKPKSDKSKSTNANSSIARSFTIGKKSTPAKNSSNSKVSSASALALAARRSREPPQSMNVSAFLRSVLASSREALDEEDEEDEEASESDESARQDDDALPRDGKETSQVGASREVSDSTRIRPHRARRNKKVSDTSDEDDNLAGLLEHMQNVERVCDMLDRAQVSSDDVDAAEDDNVSEAGTKDIDRHHRNRRKARKTESIEIYALFPHTSSGDGSDSCEHDSESPSGAATDQWSISPSSSFAKPIATSSSQDEASPRLKAPSPTLHKSSVLLHRKVRGRRSAASKHSNTASSGTEDDEAAAVARQRRREAQRLLLRKTLSGKLLRRTATSEALASLLPHTRLVKGTKARGKRSRSTTKKEHVDTPRDHTEEVSIRRAKDRKYLIPRVNRMNHFSLHVVLDLDETLVSARNGPILVRPYVGKLIQTLVDCRCEIILWTAGIPQYVAGIVAGLTMAAQGLSAAVGEQEKPPWIQHLIQRNDRWYDEDRVCVKNLKLLGRPMDRLLIIENNPAAVQLQVANAVLVQDYVVENYNDRSLEIVSRIVARCAKSIEPVAATLQSDPDLLLVEFNLAAEHSFDGKPIRPIEYGLKYSPPGSQQREHAGEVPIAVFDK